MFRRKEVERILEQARRMDPQLENVWRCRSPVQAWFAC